MKPATIVVALVSIAALSARAPGQDKSVNPGINQSFEKPDVAEFVKRFETESREVYANRKAIVEALGLHPGDAVADVGAGTGVFTRLIADRVGPKGKVYAVDISPAFLKHIEAESKKLDQAQVQTIVCPPDSTNLPANSVQTVFLCDTYHHLEYPAKTLASIHRALRPGGQLVVVEFDRRKGVSSDFVMRHVRAGKDVFIAEIEAAGFERAEVPAKPSLKENAFLRFRKTAQTKAPARENGRGAP